MAARRPKEVQAGASLFIRNSLFDLQLASMVRARWAFVLSCPVDMITAGVHSCAATLPFSMLSAPLWSVGPLEKGYTSTVMSYVAAFSAVPACQTVCRTMLHASRRLLPLTSSLHRACLARSPASASSRFHHPAANRLRCFPWFAESRPAHSVLLMLAGSAMFL
jgi:hypothetical protein